MNKKENINKSAKKTAIINQQLVSVVMPSLNQVAYLELAIRSVLEQNHCSIELIVVDGLSRDGSQDLLMTLQKEYGERLRWISQVDSGPAQAINKALKMAQGSIIGWLNSDDMYTQGAVQRAVQHFQDRPDHLMVYGQAEHIDENRRVLGVYPTKPPSTPLDEFANGCFICQPTVFMRREALEHVGFLDESIKTAFDFELWLRFFKRYPRQIGLIRRIQAQSRLHPACLTQKERQQVALDAMKVLKQHLSEVPLHWFWTHVDELCAQFPMANDEFSLIKQLEKFIIAAKNYLPNESLPLIAKKLREDQRFALSKPGLIALVQPDGWVSKSLLVKYRWPNKHVKAINLRCLAKWPIPGKLRLKIHTPYGALQAITIDVPEEFILRLEVMPTDQPGMMTWLIETAQGFIPAKYDSSSDDRRRLSFKVLEIIPEN